MEQQMLGGLMKKFYRIKRRIWLQASAILLTTITWHQTALSATDTLVVGAETSLLASTVWIADAKGFFKDEGITVSVEKFGAGRNALEAMLGRSTVGRSSVDLATVATTPIVFNSFENEPFQIIAEIAYSDDPNKVLVKKSAGINRIEDLKGKKIGVQKRASGHYYLEAYFLPRYGFSGSDMEILDIHAKDFVEKFKDKTIDAVVSWEPHISKVTKALGADDVLIFKDTVPHRKDFYITVNNSYLKENPATVGKFLRALVRASDFIKSNEEESKRLLATALNMDLELVNTIWSEYHFGVVFGENTVDRLKEEADWVIKSKFVKVDKIPDYWRIIDRRPLRDVAPGAILLKKPK